MKKFNGLKVLVADIETSPLVSFTWGLFDQNISLGQVKQDWNVLSWSAKWLKGADGTVYGPHDDVMYMDLRNSKNYANDKAILKGIWKLLDECDILVTQNGKKFDEKKLNARFILNGMKPPSSFKHVDTCQIARKKFGFTSNKLEYMTAKLCKKYKKLKHAKFSGFELWQQCLAGNKDAWKEMEDYNKADVLSLEELYNILQPWDNNINPNLYTEAMTELCSCGGSFKKKGFGYTASGRFQRYICKSCGSQVKGKTNLFSKEKKASLKSKV